MVTKLVFLSNVSYNPLAKYQGQKLKLAQLVLRSVGIWQWWEEVEVAQQEFTCKRGWRRRKGTQRKLMPVWGPKDGKYNHSKRRKM